MLQEGQGVQTDTSLATAEDSGSKLHQGLAKLDKCKRQIMKCFD